MTGYGKKQAVKQGELLFAINNQVLKQHMSDWQPVDTCCGLMRLPLLSKNTRDQGPEQASLSGTPLFAKYEQSYS